jgi:hypothetical protein
MTGVKNADNRQPKPKKGPSMPYLKLVPWLTLEEDVAAAADEAGYRHNQYKSVAYICLE